MSWSEKINNKKFLVGTTINLIFALIAGRDSTTSLLTLGYIVIAAALNQYFTILVFMRFIPTVMAPGEKKSYKRLVRDLIFKAFFLFSAFIILVTYTPNKVLYGVTLYIFQLIILFLSIKNIGQFYNKGSSK